MTLPRRFAFGLLMCLAGTEPASTQTPSGKVIELRRALGANVDIPTRDVEVDDQVYKRTMRYRGYPLADVMRQNFKDVDKTAATGAELVLRAADGYAPSMDLAKALNGDGVIAFRDLARPENDPWEPFLQGKERITPAPFYLVWPGVDPDDATYKWPYQLVEIEIQSFPQRFGAAVPKATAGGGDRARRDFAAAQMSAVNLVGGDLAPELNVPKNVTEYWRPADIKALVRDASSYRARSKMPPFAHLSDADLDALLHYLEAMKRQKICDARRPCPK